LLSIWIANSALFWQVNVSPLLPLDADHWSIGALLIDLSIYRDADGEPAGLSSRMI
jgi:hypothetical protein